MSRFRVGALLFEGFEMLDLYGPLEMYGMHPDIFTIIPVAQSMAPVRASNGPCTLPEASFEDQGLSYDILLVPGGDGTRREENNPALLTWLAEAGAQAQVITSVCTGSGLLARAGLLDGHAATTNKLGFDEVARLGPETTWQRSARWVVSGNRITSSGVSAGIDMTLAVIEQLAGKEIADEAALWAEYTRQHDADADPFAVR